MIARFRAAAPDYPGRPSTRTSSRTQRGERRVIAWSSAPLHDDTGKVVRIVAGGLDITLRKQQEEELRASRARIVAAGDDERRRLERNLHDGAQQRLVALSLALRLAQAKLTSDPARGRRAARRRERGARRRRSRSCASSRAASIPAVLTDRGLRAALEGLAARTPLPVELRPARRSGCPRADRGGRVLRRRRGGHERRQARAGDVGRRAARRRRRQRRGRGRRRRRRRGRSRERLGPARPVRPPRRARREARGREPGERRHARRRGDPAARRRRAASRS